ncbi:hypothetical protein CQW23_19119 [Capsicum baccatum]|uniref:Uncharacterized protein n=1 Tax=Capsicum baccatum TaxID=33114 RepID=A0A2G2W4W1_CAPBA|nr:hypothetical protein CQW23_19119 [Capsicum baccatum]
MQGKAAYDTPLWWGPSSDPTHSERFSEPGCLTLEFAPSFSKNSSISLYSIGPSIEEYVVFSATMIHEEHMLSKGKSSNVRQSHRAMGANESHYCFGLEDVVFAMLGWKESLMYLPLGSENDWTIAIHIAASEGDVNMINKLLNHCPDCRDLLNNNNQNALHVSVLNNQDKRYRTEWSLARPFLCRSANIRCVQGRASHTRHRYHCLEGPCPCFELQNPMLTLSTLSLTNDPSVYSASTRWGTGPTVAACG